MRILVPLDGSPLAETILPFVEDLAGRVKGRVTLLHVTDDEPAGAAPAAIEQKVQRAQMLARRYLHKHRGRLLAAGIEATVAVRSGRPAERILRFAERARADLIALSTHGRSGIQAWAHGSVADQLLHGATTPLLLVRPNDQWEAAPYATTRIVVPLDGSSEAESALAVAEHLALLGGIPLVLLQLVEPMEIPFAVHPTGVPYLGMGRFVEERAQEARVYLERVAGMLRARGIVVTTEVAVGAAVDGIASCARSQVGSLVVLASHARTGWRRLLLGSVARGVAHRVATPVVVCPAPETRIRPTNVEPRDEHGSTAHS